MRQIILDTETTGIDPKQGHRIIEIGALEMINRQITGKNLHQYINPEREVEAEALAVHGISNEFLKDKPVFKDIYLEFFEFIKGAELIIHNAPFDLGFMDHEFKKVDKSIGKTEQHCGVIDTLLMARKMHPGQRNNLNALCKRYHVDNTNRELHGALLDSELLAKVYLAMTGGQTSLFGDDPLDVNAGVMGNAAAKVERKQRQRLSVVTVSDDELKAHHEIVAKLQAEDLWNN